MSIPAYYDGLTHEGSRGCVEPTSNRDRCSATSRWRIACPADHPLRAIRRITDHALARLSPRVRPPVCPVRPPLDSARAAVARLAAAGAVYDSQRATADGAAGLQPAVPLVRGPGYRRRRVGADDVHQESRSAADWRHRGGVLRGRPAACARRRGCCRTSTSPSMARCSRPGRVTKASSRAIGRRSAGGRRR